MAASPGDAWPLTRVCKNYRRGFDIATVQIDTARRNAADLQGLDGVDLTFEVADLEGRLPEADSSVDITLCLYSVLSHLPVANLPRVTREIARVTRGHFVTTVRSIGSTLTVFIDSIDTARRFKLDHNQDRCDIEFCDGRRMALRFHLFTANELRHGFESEFAIEDLCGLDIFHGRFSSDQRWNPAACGSDPRFWNVLTQLEARFAHNPTVMEHATHLMLVGRRRAVR